MRTQLQQKQLIPLTSQLRLSVQTVCALISVWMITGCTGLPAPQPEISELKAQIVQLQSKLVDADEKLSSLNENTTRVHQDNNVHLSTLSDKIEQLTEQVVHVCDQKPVAVPSAQSADCPEPNNSVVVTDDKKLLLGEIEHVQIPDHNLVFRARMDTGASSSSVHATNLQQFERDGEDWVRFDLTSPELKKDPAQNALSIERPVKRFVRVYQQADKTGSRRPVVDLRIRVGNVQGQFEFTLADRSHLEHNMILGRNFLTDMAVVDVSQQFLQKP